MPASKSLLPLRLLVALSFALLLLPTSTHAQVLGELRGQITDPSGAVVSGAHVTLTQLNSGVRQQTDTTSTGAYDYTQLNSGVYSVTVDHTGFSTLVRSGVTVTTGQTVRLDLTLQVGSGGETVTVNSDAPPLQAATSDVATTIPGSTVIALPLNSRNFIQLTQLAPGVALPPGTVLPRINGGRPRTNEYLYDGISALQPEPGQVAFFPIIDSIAEFTVQANNVAAEFGRFNGGVVNVATRSGANQFHGSLFWFIRNEDLNARNYFASTTAAKPEYRRNLYGGSISGPILHDRLFFFGDYQGIKQRIGVTRISTVPTLPMRQGIFTNVAKIYDPTTTITTGGKVTRTEFPNDIINVPLDPAAVALLARYPIPTSSGAANNYTRTANDDDHQNQFDFRVDAAFGPHDRGFARYTYYNEVEQPVTPLPDGSGAISGSVIGTGNVAGLTNILGQQFVINETHTFSPIVLNDLRIGYTRRGNSQLGATLSTTASTALGIPGIPTNASFNNVLPLFTLTGLQQLGASASTSANYQTSVSELVDTVVFTHGPHSLKVGADMRRYELNAISPPNPTGSFAFTTTGTDTTGTTGATGGNAVASFLLGQVDTFSIDLQTRTIRPRDYIHEFFVQDDYRVSSRLILNIGARWTLHLPLHRNPQPGRSLQPRHPAARLPRRQRLPPQRAPASLGERRSPRRPRVFARLKDRRPYRFRHRLHRPEWHHHALHHATVSIHPERAAAYAGRLHPRLQTLQRPHRLVHSSNPRCRPRPERLHRHSQRRLRILRAVEPGRATRYHQSSFL